MLFYREWNSRSIISLNWDDGGWTRVQNLLDLSNYWYLSLIWSFLCLYQLNTWSIFGQYFVYAWSLLGQCLVNWSLLAQCLVNTWSNSWPMLGMKSHTRDLGMNSHSFLLRQFFLNQTIQTGSNKVILIGL